MDVDQSPRAKWVPQLIVNRVLDKWATMVGRKEKEKEKIYF